MSLRIEKVQKEVHGLISQYLLLHFPYKNDVMVSISNIVVSKDLKLAKVYYSFYSPLDIQLDQGEVAAVLNEEKKEVQSYIANNLKMKYTPKISFYLDNSIEENFAMVQKLRDLGYAKTPVSESESI